MRPITKSTEPRSLAQYRQKQGVAFGNMPAKSKQDLKDQLLREQGHLCAYCMSRIELPTMKVEHWHCQRNYPHDQLSYPNLLACCAGGEGEPPLLQHCDTGKGDADLDFNPANPSHHGKLKIRFLGNGNILSADGGFDAQLNQVLNLNLGKLVNYRKKVVEAVQLTLGSRPGLRTKAELDRLVRRWENPDSHGRLPEFCEVALYLLRKHPNY